MLLKPDWKTKLFPRTTPTQPELSLFPVGVGNLDSCRGSASAAVSLQGGEQSVGLCTGDFYQSEGESGLSLRGSLCLVTYQLWYPSSEVGSSEPKGGTFYPQYLQKREILLNDNYRNLGE